MDVDNSLQSIAEARNRAITCERADEVRAPPQPDGADALARR